jgi:succinyl-CoA synthetase beta subunit
VEEGRAIIAESGMKVQIGATMKEAADLAVAAAKG